MQNEPRARPDLEHQRKAAKALLRAYRAGEPGARERAEGVLGERARRRFQLSDAQHVVARERGHRSWSDMKRACEGRPQPAGEPELEGIRSALARARAAWGERGETVLDAGLAYGDGEPVRVRVRKRGRRYSIDDDGRAAAKARRRPGWLERAREVVAEDALNVNRAGVVFVPAVEGRDIAALAFRVAQTSLALYGELAALDDDGR